MNQVVIAVGGRGERTRPVSEVIPKPLFEIDGRSFVFHLIQQFVARGATDFLILTGYLEDQFVSEAAHLSSFFGVKIETSFADISNETGFRIYQAKHLLSENFVFLYGDVFLPLTDKQIDLLLTSNELLFSVYQGEFRKGSCNTYVKDGNFVSYGNVQSNNNNAINCGYFVIQKGLVESFINLPLEKIILEKMSKILHPKVIICRNKYYTVGDPERLSQIRNYFESAPTILFDRDGTLLRGLGPGEFHANFEKIDWKLGVLDFLKELSNRKVRIVIITNQPAVGNGHMSLEEMLSINQEINQVFISNGIYVNSYFICAHGWNESCDCRKPAPGLFYEAQHWLDINWKKAIYLGDMDRDREAAEAVGCRFIKVDAGESQWQIEVSNEVLHLIDSFG